MANYVVDYYNQIKRGKIVACESIKAVYEREVNWILNPPKDFPFYFDEKVGARPIEFVEKFCKHSKGAVAGMDLKLEPFQKAKFQLAHGWLHKDTDKRRFAEVIDVRGRKTGKSTETAALGLYHLVADGEMGAEVYTVANKLDQAKIIFNEAANMRVQSPEIKALTEKRRTDIYFPLTMSFLMALASDSSTMDGLNCSFFSQDEIHAAKDSSIYDVMKQSQAAMARLQPLAWIITTNGFVREGHFDQVYEYAKGVAFWNYEDYTLLPLIHELDSREEWADPKAWEKANPGLGKIKSYDFLKQSVEKAKADTRYKKTVMTKDFNLPENATDSWLTFSDIVNEELIDMKDVDNNYAVGGCDLSATTDLTCATLLVKKKDDHNFYCLQKYFMPETKLRQVEQEQTRKEAPYALWEKQGWLTICEGSTVDYRQVTAWFVKMVEVHGVRPLWVFYDRALAGYWATEMQEYGFDMEKLAQGPFTWTYPMKQLGGLLQDKKLIYDNNPMLRWCLVNTKSKSLNRDGVESVQPIKAGERMRIDGMVSLLNAYTGYLKKEAEYTEYLG